MPIQISTDAYGTTYFIPAEDAVKTSGDQRRPGCPTVEVWWSRDGNKADETLIVRQEHPGRAHAEVVELTFGQVYDLIEGLNRAVESK